MRLAETVAQGGLQRNAVGSAWGADVTSTNDPGVGVVLSPVAGLSVVHTHPRLSVTLMGGFGLLVDGAPAELPATCQRLVALLALGGRMSRSRLAGSLWPETPEQRALASLRTGIWRTNQVAHRLVMPSGGMVDLSSTVDVDTRRFVGAALQIMGPGSSDLAAQRPGPVPEVAEFAVDVLVADGELLPDWEDDWLVAERERLRQLRLHVLESTAARLSETGDYGLALEVALASLRIDPLRESAHRSVIRIHLAEGNVVEARRALDTCRETLMRDVGVGLSTETVDLVPLPQPRTAHASGVPAPR